MDSWGERCTNWAYQYLFDLVDRECLGLGAWPSKLLQLSVESWGSDSSRCTTSYQMRLRFEVTSGGSQLKMSSLTIPDPSRPASFAADSLCTIAAIVIASESHERHPVGCRVRFVAAQCSVARNSNLHFPSARQQKDDASERRLCPEMETWRVCGLVQFEIPSDCTCPSEPTHGATRPEASRRFLGPMDH